MMRSAGDTQVRAPYSSAFGEFNYYPASAFKRTTSDPAVSRMEGTGGGGAQRDTGSAVPLLRRYRSNSSPNVRVARGGGGLHSAAAIRAGQRPNGRTPTSRGTSEGGAGSRRVSPAASERGLRRQASPPATGPRFSTDRSEYNPNAAGTRPDDPKAPLATPATKGRVWHLTDSPAGTAAVAAGARPPWNSSVATGHSLSTGLQPPPSKQLRQRHSTTSLSPGGVTPSTDAADRSPASANRGSGASRLSDSPFLSRHLGAGSADVSICVDEQCIHSRQSIAEFIEMQRELRRCYNLMGGHDATVSALRERLATAEAALAEKDAIMEARIHELEKEFLVELSRREHEARKDALAQARAELAAETVTHTPQYRSGSSSNSSSNITCSSADDENVDGRIAHDVSDREGAAYKEEIDRMREVIVELEDALEQKHVECDEVSARLRASEEEKGRLQTHVRLLSTWKEDRLREAEAQSSTPACPPSQLDDAGVGAACASSPPTVSDPCTHSSSPLQALFARSTSTPSKQSPQRTPPTPQTATGRAAAMLMGPQEATPAAHRTITPRRAAPPAPASQAPPQSASSSVTLARSWSALGRRKVFGTGPASAQATTPVDEDQHEVATPRPVVIDSSNNSSRSTPSRGLAVAEARCRELLRALLDKERQLATLAAERTRFKALCEAGLPTRAGASGLW